MPTAIRWIAAVLREIPGPTDGWADIIGSLAWPLLVLFLIYRFRWFLRRFLLTVAERVETDDLKLGPFELRMRDDVVVLDPDDVDDSTITFDPADIHRIERMFEFISSVEDGLDRLQVWLNETVAEELDVVDLLELPIYAPLRERAFAEVEGLSE